MMKRIGRAWILAGVLVLLWVRGAAGKEGATVLKIFVERDGIVRLTRADLVDAGFPVGGLDPRLLHLTTGGVEVPMLVLGEDDGAFDPGDAILFYGLAATDLSEDQPGGPYTRRNVYWLTAGAEPGLRMHEVDGAFNPAYPTPATFSDTLHVEEDRFYWQNPPEGRAADHWFWADEMQAPAVVTRTFTLDGIASEAEAALRVRLRGRTDDAAAPDHHTRLTLNGTRLDEARWDGDVPFTHTVAFSSTLLASGVNTLTVGSLGDTGAAVDAVYLNWLELDYRRAYTATASSTGSGRALRFTAPSSGTFAFEIGGFGADDVWLFDVSDPLSPKRVISTTVSEGTLRFSASATPSTRYLALTPAAWQAPAGLALDTPSDLRDGGQGADEIIIAPSDFHAALAPLVEHRQAEDLRVALVDVQEVYDEFSYGRFDPRAIHDFLNYAYHHWQPPAPRFVLLVGDANMDYLDRLGSGAPNHVPALLIDTWPVGETPSDNGYVRLEGDDVLPEMALGRIPARTADKVSRVVDKIIAYESAPPGDWNARALFVADDASAFETASEALIEALPPAYRSRRLYASGYDGDLTASISRTIGEGALLVNYVGHGSVNDWGTWAGGRIWSEADVEALDNESLPFVTAATCLTGFFAHPLDARSLAESWLLAEHGAVAAWAPTALGDPAGHEVLLGALYETLLDPAASSGQEDVVRIGEATRQTKWAAYEESPVLGSLVETYVLFGDPATRLQVLDRPYAAYLPWVVR